MQEDDHKPNMFRLMHQALQKSRCISEEVVFLTGEIRSGKSTTFDWICNPDILIGSGRQLKPIYEINERMSIQADYAEIRDCYKSVTLIPNARLLPDQKTTLVDLPGNKDCRSEVEVMMVSFILNVFFKAAKRAKFIIVISNDFISTKGAQFVEAIKFFVKLLGFQRMSKEEREQIYPSVSLLITAVKIQEGQYEQMKEVYCVELKQNIKRLNGISQSSLKGIFPYIEQLLLHISKEKRLQIFPEAKLKKIPERCQLFERLASRQWKSINMVKIYNKLQFPYREQFLQLSQESQTSLQDTIKQKLIQFQQLQTLLGELISNFLDNPLTCDSEYFKPTFDQLETLLKNCSFKDLQQFDNDNDNQEDRLFSLEVVKGILQLYKFTFEICFDSERDEASQIQTPYFQYLQRTYFRQTMKIIKTSFAVTERQGYILDMLSNLMAQIFEFFTYICGMDMEIKSVAINRLKEAVSVMNVPNYKDTQIKGKYLQKLKENSHYIGYLDTKDTEQLILFIRGLPQKQYDVLLVLQILYQCYKGRGESLRGEEIYSQALQCILECLVTSIFIKLYLQFQLDNNLTDKNDLASQIKRYQQNSQQLIKIIGQLLVQVNERKNDNIKNMYQEVGMYKELQEIYKYSSQLNYKTIYQKIKQYEQLMNFYERRQEFTKALNICQHKILQNKELKGSKNAQSKQTIQIYKRMKQQINDKIRRSTYGMKEQQNQNYLPKQTAYLKLVESLFTQFFHIQRVYNLEAMRNTVREHYKKVVEYQKMANEFSIQIPEQLSLFSTLAISNHLTSKINKRKSIILLGRKSGKSAATYWLRGKPLIKKERGQGYYLMLPDNVRQPDRIHHPFLKHTEVPNLYSLGKTEVLVDVPRCYSGNIQKIMCVGHIMREVIGNSSQCKFIMVVKQSQILDNMGTSLIELLGQYINMFNEFNVEQSQGLILLISCGNSKNKAMVRQMFIKLYNEFEEVDNSEIIQQKYKINSQKRPLRTQYITLLNYLFTRAMYIYFNAECQLSKNKMVIQDMPLTWKYMEAGKKDILNPFSYTSISVVKEAPFRQFAQEIKIKFKILKSAGSVFKKLANLYVQHYIKRQYDSQSEKQELDKLLSLNPQIRFRLKRDKTFKNIQYPDLKIDQKTKNQELKILQFCISMHRLIQIQVKMCEYDVNLNVVADLIQESLLNLIGACPDTTECEFLEDCMIHIHQNLKELCLYNEQIQVLKNSQQLSQQQKGEYSYLFSDVIELKTAFGLASQLRWTQTFGIFLDHFNYQQFVQDNGSNEESSAKLFECLMSFEVPLCTKFITIDKVFGKKISRILLSFADETSNDEQAVRLLLFLSRIHICEHEREGAIERELVLQLLTILQRLSLRLGQFGLTVCDWLGNHETKIKLFERILHAKPEQNRLLELIKFLQSRGSYESKILELLQKHDELLGERAENIKLKVLQSSKVEAEAVNQRSHSLEQLKGFIWKIRTKMEILNVDHL